MKKVKDNPEAVKHVDEILTELREKLLNSEEYETCIELGKKSKVSLDSATIEWIATGGVTYVFKINGGAER